MTTAAELFIADHAPGLRVLSASKWPSLVVPPEQRPAWMPSPLALALHMTGEAPLEATGPHLRMGKLMETVGEQVLAEDWGLHLTKRQPRFEAPDIPAVCYPDGLMDNGDLVEFKTVLGGQRGYDERWADGVPLHVRAQAAAQMLISSRRRMFVVPIIIGYGITVEPLLIEHDPAVERVLFDAGRDFLAMLDRDELPAADATPSSYEALMRTLRIKPEKRIALEDPAFADFAQAWRSANAQRLAAEKIEEGARNAIAAVAGDAEIIELSDGSTIRRKSVTRRAVPKPKPQPESQYWRWDPSPREQK